MEIHMIVLYSVGFDGRISFKPRLAKNTRFPFWRRSHWDRLFHIQSGVAMDMWIVISFDACSRSYAIHSFYVVSSHAMCAVRQLIVYNERLTSTLECMLLTPRGKNGQLIKTY